MCVCVCECVCVRERERETFDLRSSRYSKRPSSIPMKHCISAGVCIISGRFLGRSGKHKIVTGLIVFIVHYKVACE